MNNEQLSTMASDVSSDVYRNDVTHYTRNEMQEAFRAAAIARGVVDKTPDMGSVVTRCMSRAGFGT
jgi:hypothetical protein